MFDIDKYRQVRKDYFGETFEEATEGYHKYKEAKELQMFYVIIDGVSYPSDQLPPTSTNEETIDRRERRKRSKMKTSPVAFSNYDHYAAQFIDFAFLPTATCPPPVPKKSFFDGKGCKKQEGKTPMRYNDNTAIASVTVQSNADTQREYFLSRLDDARWPKLAELEKLFNLNIDNTPKNYEELIAAIKGDKYTISKKIQEKFATSKEEGDGVYGVYGVSWGYGPTYGFVWEGPQPDRKGYNKATAEMVKEMNSARDLIMSSDAAGMAKAVAYYEAWTPTNTAD